MDMVNYLNRIKRCKVTWSFSCFRSQSPIEVTTGDCPYVSPQEQGLHTRVCTHAHTYTNGITIPTGLHLAFSAGEGLLFNMVNSGLLTQRSVKVENHYRMNGCTVCIINLLFLNLLFLCKTPMHVHSAIFDSLL